VLLATGYRRAFPFLESVRGMLRARADREVRTRRPAFSPSCTAATPRWPSWVIFETDGAAYDLFARSRRRSVAGTLEALQGRGADEIRETIADDTPDQRGGSRYIDSTRHDFYVTGRAYRRALRAFSRRLEASTLAGLTT
jgi:hypothetical protein